MMRLSTTLHLLFFVAGSVVAQSTAPSPAPAPTPTQAPPPSAPVAKLSLPTDNDAIFRNDGPAFYMFVDRDFEQQKSTPWEGGQFGYVRGPVRLGDKVIQMHFHEGVDIAPTKRDASGEPLDEVRSISQGEVVHASLSAGASN